MKNDQDIVYAVSQNECIYYVLQIYTNEEKEKLKPLKDLRRFKIEIPSNIEHSAPGNLEVHINENRHHILYVLPSKILNLISEMYNQKNPN